MGVAFFDGRFELVKSTSRMPRLGTLNVPLKWTSSIMYPAGADGSRDPCGKSCTCSWPGLNVGVTTCPTGTSGSLYLCVALRQTSRSPRCDRSGSPIFSQ